VKQPSLYAIKTNEQARADKNYLEIFFSFLRGTLPFEVVTVILSGVISLSGIVDFITKTYQALKKFYTLMQTKFSAVDNSIFDSSESDGSLGLSIVSESPTRIKTLLLFFWWITSPYWDSSKYLVFQIEQPSGFPWG